MKHLVRAAGLLSLAILGGLDSLAGESYRLNAVIYSFRSADVHVSDASGPASGGDSHVRLLQSPATVQFDQDTLVLEGSTCIWNGGPNPPARFTQIKAPELTLAPGKPVALLSSAPVQYLERLENGSLQVRDIPADSAEAPHCRIRFSLVRALDSGQGFELICDVDVVTVIGRESLPGVTLDVGKPRMNRFEDSVAATVAADAWSGLLLPVLNGGDYSLLVLLKVSAEHAVNEAAGAGDVSGRMTAEELDHFATYYYRNPQPQCVARAIESLEASGFAKDRAEVFVGFFAEVFSANSDQLAAWRSLGERQDHAVTDLLRKARRASRPGVGLTQATPSVRQNDRCWGAFFASGDASYLRSLIDVLALVHESERDGFWVGATAMWSLARNADEHPLVRSTLESARAKATPRTRALIDEILTTDVVSVREKILALAQVAANARSSAAGSPGYHGPRDMGYFGPVSPSSEASMRK